MATKPIEINEKNKEDEELSELSKLEEKVEDLKSQAVNLNKEMVSVFEKFHVNMDFETEEIDCISENSTSRLENLHSKIENISEILCKIQRIRDNIDEKIR